MLMWTIFFVLVCGTRAQILAKPLSSTLPIASTHNFYLHEVEFFTHLAGKQANTNVFQSIHTDSDDRHIYIYIYIVTQYLTTCTNMRHYASLFWHANKYKQLYFRVYELTREIVSIHSFRQFLPQRGTMLYSFGGHTY
jgi:hypothetical protein